MLTGIIRLFFKRKIVDKGLRDGSSPWLIIGAFSLLRRMYRSLGPRSERIRLKEQLRPGDELLLRYPGKPHRKVRKETRIVAAKRVEAAAAQETRRRQLAAIADGKGRRSRQAKQALERLDTSRT
jgi:hypothetical protein